MTRCTVARRTACSATGTRFVTSSAGDGGGAIVASGRPVVFST
jgi:hypothetical protein